MCATAELGTGDVAARWMFCGLFRSGASAAVCCLCHCVSLLVCPGDISFWIVVRQRFGKEAVILLAACTLLVEVPLLLVQPSFPLVSDVRC